MLASETVDHNKVAVISWDLSVSDQTMNGGYLVKAVRSGKETMRALHGDE